MPVSRRKILFVMTNIPPASLGGAEKQVLMLLGALVANGWDITLVGRRTAPGYDGAPDGMRVVQLRPIAGIRHYGYMLALVWWLVLNAHRYPILHFVDADQLTGLGLWVTRTSKSRRILRYESEAGLVLRRLQSARLPLIRQLAWRGLQSADSVVYVSQVLRGDLISTFKYSRDRLQYVPNCIDVTAFHQATTSGRTKVAVCPARLRPEKNHEQLLRAWQLVAQRDPEARLWLVGDGRLSNPLRSLANELGVRDSVDFMGYRDDMPSIYVQSQVCVLLSHTEADPLVLLEAAAAGVPCVATRVGGIPDIVIDGVTGILVEPGDTEGAADAVSRLLSDPDSAQEMGRAARAHIGNTRSLKSFVVAYERLLSEPGSQRRS